MDAVFRTQDLTKVYNTGETQVRALDGVNLELVTGPVRQPGFQSRVVQNDRPICIVPEGHHLAARGSVTLAELKHFAFDVNRMGIHMGLIV